MAAMRRTTAQADTFDTAAYSLEGEAQPAGEKRNLSLGSHQSGLLTLFFRRGQVAYYTHTRTLQILDSLKQTTAEC